MGHFNTLYKLDPMVCLQHEGKPELCTTLCRRLVCPDCSIPFFAAAGVLAVEQCRDYHLPADKSH